MKSTRLTQAVLVATLAAGAVVVPAAAASAQPVACGVKAELDLGRGKATSWCISPGPQDAKEHRAVIKCTVVRGRNTPHDLTFPVWGPWVKIGQKSTAMCGFSSSTAGFSYEIR
ncbi:hypothetical protein ACIQ9P_31995 [Kitasatospora sp. NPDC094019]|uniref:hypothetical protein n=1 Tax=Kitasatospora sp. NPDC094019 TaxID=3364091 RepID=UPI0038232080